MFDLSSRTALVTGAATGLGQAIAGALAGAGAEVAVSDLPGVSLDETIGLCADRGKRPFGLAIDVRHTDQVRNGIAEVTSRMGRVDILVNNAGINVPTPGLEVEEHLWDEHFNTNVRGGFFCAQSVARKMIEQRFGRIVFVSSQSGLVGIPGQPVYCASKGAVVNLVRALGVEWAKHGITVNSVAPTFVETNMTRARLQQPRFRQFVIDKIPRGEIASGDDVAAAVLFLASDEAGMVNCATLPVDGGWTAW